MNDILFIVFICNIFVRCVQNSGPAYGCEGRGRHRECSIYYNSDVDMNKIQYPSVMGFGRMTLGVKAQNDNCYARRT